MITTKLEDRVDNILRNLSMYFVTHLDVDNAESRVPLGDSREGIKKVTRVKFTLNHLLEETEYPKTVITFTIYGNKLSDDINIEIIDKYKLDETNTTVNTTKRLEKSYNNAPALYQEVCLKLRDNTVIELLMNYIL